MEPNEQDSHSVLRVRNFLLALGFGNTLHVVSRQNTVILTVNPSISIGRVDQFLPLCAFSPPPPKILSPLWPCER